jgi:hypothetical protein
VWQIGLNPRRLVLIDETWASTKTTRLLGRASWDAEQTHDVLMDYARRHLLSEDEPGVLVIACRKGGGADPADRAGDPATVAGDHLAAAD